MASVDDAAPGRFQSLVVRSADVPPVTLSSLGLPALDQALPWGGLPQGCLHEVTGPANDAAAIGFTAWLAGVVSRGGWILWCRSERRRREAGQLYGPALARFGLETERLLLVKTRADQDLLWAMEEGLRARRFAAVVGEGVVPDLTQTRRLQLAAETGAATAFLILPPRAGRISAAMTRWVVQASPAANPARAPWHVRLDRCRGGAHGAWTVEWNDEALRLDLSAPLADGLLAAAE